MLGVLLRRNCAVAKGSTVKMIKMKTIFKFLFSLVFIMGCSAQNQTQEVKLYDSFIEKENYTLKMSRNKSEDAHFISFSRKTDSIFLEMEISPSLDKIFDNVSPLKNNKLVGMTLIKENEMYAIFQINFLHFDNRNISLHKHSAEMFLLDLDDYQINIIECVNCTDKVYFILFENDDN
jgi:hypothetical protein